jgi:hypothetical protein
MLLAQVAQSLFFFVPLSLLFLAAHEREAKNFASKNNISTSHAQQNPMRKLTRGEFNLSRRNCRIPTQSYCESGGGGGFRPRGVSRIRRSNVITRYTRKNTQNEGANRERARERKQLAIKCWIKKTQPLRGVRNPFSTRPPGPTLCICQIKARVHFHAADPLLNNDNSPL